jgi:hypothetical protein
MGVADLFRPKWKHSNPTVRAEAVRELTDQDDASVLGDIARHDVSQEIRRLAVERIEDIDALSDIAASDPDTEVRQAATGRVTEMWAARAIAATDEPSALTAIEHVDEPRTLARLAVRAAVATARKAALARLSDARALAEVVRNASDVGTCLDAVRKIEDEDVLGRIAVDTDDKRIGYAALDRIAGKTTLEMIAGKGKHRGVRSRAQKQLAKLAPAAAPPSVAKARHAEQSQLVRRLEEMLGRAVWKQGESVAELERTWAALAPHDTELAARFGRAHDRYTDEARRYQDQLAELRHEQEEAAAPPAPPRETPPAVTPAPEPAPTFIAEGTPIPVAAQETAPLPAAAQGGSHDDDAEIAPAASAARPDRPDRVRRREENRVELEALCAEMERGLEQTSFRAIEALLRRALADVESVRDLPTREVREQLGARFEAARNALWARVRELREADEWKRWANAPLQEELITRAQALLARKDEADLDLGAELKALQIEWKKVGAVARSKGETLWQKFKELSDEIYATASLQLEARKQAQTENLARKRALCEQVEVLVDSTDWEATASEIKRLQAEWKEVGPVPRRQSQKVWQRFRTACDAFFERRKPHLEQQLGGLQENLAQKADLCGRAEALAQTMTADTDWNSGLAEVKELQRAWRDAGPTPRRESDAIYQRFRAACDGVFARRDELVELARQAARTQRAKDLEAIEASFAGELSPAERAGRLCEAWAKVRVLEGELGSAVLELERRVYQATAAALAIDAESFRGTELDAEAARRKKERLCARAEALAPAAAAPASAAPTAQEMAERLREALAQRALGGIFVQPETDGAAQIPSLEAAWRRVGPVASAAEDTALADRFAAACAATRPRTADAAPAPAPSASTPTVSVDEPAATIDEGWD